MQPQPHTLRCANNFVRFAYHPSALACTYVPGSTQGTDTGMFFIVHAITQLQHACTPQFRPPPYSITESKTMVHIMACRSPSLRTLTANIYITS